MKKIIGVFLIIGVLCAIGDVCIDRVPHNYKIINANLQKIKIKGNKNIRSHLKSPLNIGTKKPKKNEVQLKPINPFFLTLYFSKFTSTAITYPLKNLLPV